MSLVETPAATVDAPGLALKPRREPLAVSSRFADYLELTKPRIAVMAMITVAVGFALGSTGAVDFALLGHAALGIGLVAASSSMLNQLLEQETDAQMLRTAQRPLPSGRLPSWEVAIVGIACGVFGCVQLAWNVNLLTAALALATLLLYVVLYTPLKKRTSLCTTVGAIPGALPPVLGWVAAGGGLNSGALALFAILFLWQFPHFLAIAWLYREDYEAAGLRMLPGVRPRSRIVGVMAVAYAIVLIPVSLLPTQIGLAGAGYFLSAVVLGAGYLFCAVRFLRNETVATARRLIWSSLIYLPLLLAALTWNHFELLR